MTLKNDEKYEAFYQEDKKVEFEDDQLLKDIKKQLKPSVDEGTVVDIHTDLLFCRLNILYLHDMRFSPILQGLYV